MAWEQIFKLNGYNCAYLTNTTDRPSYQYGGDCLQIGNTPCSLTGVGSKTWNVTQNVKCDTSIGTGSSHNAGWLYINGTQYGGWVGLAYNGAEADFIFFINHEILEADAFFVVSGVIGYTVCGYSIGNSNARKTLYNELMGIMPYYQAVNYITGNNKTYNLSKILTINGGDPVSNAVASSVNLNNDSRLDNLMSNA